MRNQIFTMLVIIIVYGLLSGCVSTSMAPAATLSPASFEETQPIAEQFVDHLSKGSFGEAVKLFDPALSGAALEAKLKQAWEGEISQVGTFQQRTEIQTDVVKGMRAVYVTCQFEKAVVDVRIFFNAANQIRGDWNFSQKKP